MNVTAGNTASKDTTQSQQTMQDKTVASEKVNQATKTEEKKDEKLSEQKGEFKKILEDTQTNEKALIDECNQEQNINISIDEQYTNKFSFDFVSKYKTTDFASLYNFDTATISKDDAKFFVDLVENKQFALQQNGENTTLIKFSDEIGPTYKTQQTSKVLSDLITKAYTEGKPIRLDFDNNCSVVLKIDSKGKVSAEFIPGDKAVEAYLRNNIGFLKQRFDEQNLPYNDLLYRQSNQNNRERRQNQQNKGE